MDSKNSANSVIPLRFRVNAAESDLVATRLFSAGATAVAELVDPQTGTTYLVADLSPVARSVLAAEGLASEYVPADDVDWVQTAAEFAEPHWCGQHVLLVPEGLDTSKIPNRPPRQSNLEAIDQDVTIITLPTTATFGSGSHPTTRLAAELVEKTVQAGNTMLDVGSGSGVLAVLAAMRGAAQVSACDVDETAVHATRSLAVSHDVENLVVTSHGSLDTMDAESLDAGFDLIAANVLFVVHRDLATSLQKALRPTGTLIVSGLLSEQRYDVVELYSPLRVTEELVEDGWLALTLQHDKPA